MTVHPSEIEAVLEGWGLKLPDSARVERGMKIVDTVTAEDTDVWKVNIRHTVRLRPPVADCSCEDFDTRQKALGSGCKHHVALAAHMLSHGIRPPVLNDPTKAPARPVSPTAEPVDDWLDETPVAAPAPQPVAPAPPEPASQAPSGFIGWQLGAMVEAIRASENILLIGPTGTGKTFAVHESLRILDELGMVPVDGKEGLTDLDFFGALLPQPDGTRQWVDGPLLRAMRAAQVAPVLLFLDEFNRIPRVYLNLLLGLMNPKTGEVCYRMGIEVEGDGPYYVIEVPMTSEIVYCLASYLHIVAAGNFGRAYQVYDLDPAVRRRFDTVIEFDYLPFDDERALVTRQARLNDKVANALVRVAQETRRLLGNGELPGCVDTASLLNWAGKCERSSASTVADVMKQARLVWADLACGRDHTGRINDANFKAIQDYLVSLSLLPTGKIT